MSERELEYPLGPDSPTRIVTGYEAVTTLDLPAGFYPQLPPKRWTPPISPKRLKELRSFADSAASARQLVTIGSSELGHLLDAYEDWLGEYAR